MATEKLEFSKVNLDGAQILEARTILDKVASDGPQVIFFGAHRDLPSHLRIPVIVANVSNNSVSLHLRHIGVDEINNTNLISAIGLETEDVPSNTLSSCDSETGALEIDLGGMSRHLRVVNENPEAFVDIVIRIQPDMVDCVARSIHETDAPQSLLKIASETFTGKGEWKSLPLGV